MDCTHDNETPMQKRIAEDTLANAALVCMSVSAAGSVYGYDQLVPKHLNVVKEKRHYAIPGYHGKQGITPVKRYLQSLHFLMGQQGYTEIHVHQEKSVSMHSM